MRSNAAALVSLLVLSSISFAQQNPPAQQPPGGLNPEGALNSQHAPRKPNGELSKADLPGSWKGLKVPPKKTSFDPKDLSGVWTKGRGGSFAVVMTDPPPPPMTAAGKAKFDAAKPLYGPRAVVGAYGNDPVMTCDPLGMPRNLFLEVSVYDMQFAQGIPGRVMQFFEWQHVYRNIWTDGRSLPNDAEPTWMGYSIGHWDGNTFVVETTGMNDTGKTWLDHFGDPIDGNAKLTERYTRLDADHLQMVIEIDDPTIYTAKWVSKPRLLNLVPDGDFQEVFCVPSEEESFNKNIRDPAGGVNVQGVGPGAVKAPK